MRLPRAERAAGTGLLGYDALMTREDLQDVTRLLEEIAEGRTQAAEDLLPRDEDGVRRLVAVVRHKPPPMPSFLVRDILARRLREEWIVRRTLESMRAGRDWLNGTLGRADMPVLVIWGRQDRLIPVAYAAPLQAEFPHAALKLLDDCGHVPMADCPEAFDRALTEFLAASMPAPAH